MNISTIECTSHPGEQVLGICLAEKCELTSRLVCFSCNTEEHSQHARSVVRIHDLETKTLFEHKNWPLNDLANDIKNYVATQELVQQGGEQAVDKMFAEITQRVLSEIEKAKIAVKKQLEKTFNNTPESSQADELLEKLRTQTNEIFGLEQLGALYNTLQNSEISSAEFNIEVSDWLKNVNNEEVLVPLSTLLETEREKLKLVLDSTAIKEKSNEIVQMVKELSVDVITESTLGVTIKWLPQTNQKDLIKITEGGRQAFMPSSYQGIFTSQLFEKGQWEFEIYSNSNMSSNCVLFGMVPEENKETTNSNYSSHPYHCWPNGCSSYQTNVGGSTLESLYKQGNTLRVYIDMDNNKYEYGWKGQKSQHILNNYTLKGQKMRFYINSFGIGNLEFKIMKSKRTGQTELTYESSTSTSETTTTAPVTTNEEW